MKVQDRQNGPSKSFRAYQKKLAGYAPACSGCGAASDREASRHFYRVACLMASRLNVQGKHRTCCVDFTIESFLDGLNMALRRL